MLEGIHVNSLVIHENSPTCQPSHDLSKTNQGLTQRAEIKNVSDTQDA